MKPRSKTYTFTEFEPQGLMTKRYPLDQVIVVNVYVAREMSNLNPKIQNNKYKNKRKLEPIKWRYPNPNTEKLVTIVVGSRMSNIKPCL